MTKRRVFKLFACCLLTDGATRSTISDVQRNKIFFIPNALHHILTTQSELCIDEIKASYNNKFDNEIQEYFEFLIQNELGFFCENLENFPPIDLTWERPELITNSIIDIDKTSKYDVKKFLSSLERLRCKNIEFRIFDGYDLNDLKHLCTLLHSSMLRYVSLIVNHHNSMTLDAIRSLLISQSRIQNIVIFNCTHEYHEDMIYFTKQAIHSSSCCGVVNPAQFSPNLDLFSESQNYNTCLNRKICVDATGFVKNCPSMTTHFGHVDDVDLSEVVANPEFKKYWTVNKGQIEICRVCEFRHVCTDCRAYLTDPDNYLSKPAKCSYDPFTNTW